MEFIPEDIQQYAEDHTSPESPVLKKLNRETNSKILMPRMLSGHLQGRILSMFSNMIRPKNVLEIGTYTGYSAICLAEGLAEGGKITTIDKNEELEDMVRLYFEEAGITEKVDFIIGNALDVIANLKQMFDLVFIDADKINYSNYYDLVIEKVPQGGYIIADNVLWSGKVVEEGKRDKDTKALIEFNTRVHQDGRVENVLFPVRDGLMILRKL
ncbi:MAG: O-methyltransferase [Candidatus Cyclobacteriaceae bacterium M2_1C_046]